MTNWIFYYIFVCEIYSATIAQVVERHIGNVEVTGPTPVSSSFILIGFLCTIHGKPIFHLCMAYVLIVIKSFLSYIYI